MKTKCDICGTKCNEDLKIIDRKYHPPFQNNAVVCKTCFDLWLLPDEQELLNRMKNKIFKNFGVKENK